MSKKLSEMTLKELWRLFPIRLTEYNGEWAEQYEKMAVFLKEKLSSCNVVRISHVGSTAISGIWAKPIVDILVEIAPDEDMDTIAKEYEQLKLNLWHQYENNRDAYTEAKTEFIKKHTLDARSQYGNCKEGDKKK